MNQEFQYGSERLSILKVIRLAEGKIRGVLSEDALARIRRSQQNVSDIVSDNKTVYGINTGFGVLANTHISAEDTKTLQHKILQSHSVGVGKPISAFLSKIMMITKVHSLAK
ncbi:MAG TPA: aromatic amino acid lyase, partial [Puia sp.]|nr:aromatic amino acid lyase [Puia sp.]